jgi:hypothetical protein
VVEPAGGVLPFRLCDASKADCGVREMGRVGCLNGCFPVCCC